MAEPEGGTNAGETDPPLFYAGFADVLKLERARIEAHWGRGPVDRDDLTGLALSGGGIRSASFAMGALQQLRNAGIVDQLHYLSSVSGGGYTAASLTWFLTRGGELANKNPFPFGGGPPAGERLAHRADLDQEAPNPGARAPANTPLSDIAGRQLVDFIRQRSSYLLPANLGLLSALTVVLRSVLTSLASYFTLFTFVALALFWAFPGEALAGLHFAPLLAGALLAATLGIVMLGYSILAPFRWWSQSGYGLRRTSQEAGGLLLGFAIFFAVLAAWLHLAVDPQRAAAWLPLGSGATIGAAGAGLGVLGGLATRAFANADGGFWLRLLKPILPALSLFLLVTGLGIAAFAFAAWLRSWDGWSAEAIAVGTGLAYLLCANLNLTGLNRFYRDRLMECFLPDIEDVVSDKPSQATSADGAALADMFPAGHPGPFHIINTNVILFNAKHARYRGRRGDSFFLTPLYCGSEATGFVSTKLWQPPGGWPLRRTGPMTLATAMAISGAAVNPNTAPGGGSAVTQNPFVSAVLTMLNLRLGYWAPSPILARDGAGKIGYRSSHLMPPNHLWPGVTHGLLGLNRNERSRWLELTDGGHFDNTGVYELVRRRVKTIYMIDAAEDPEVSFANFANVAERIFIDFDVTLTFPDPEHSFAKLMTGSASSDDPLTKRFMLADKGFAVADIHYPPVAGDAPGDYRPALAGRLYMVKATMTAGLPAALYAYKADHAAFPWETALDQFFDEQQFEAYRALGFTLTKQLTGYLSPSMKAVAPNLA